MKLKTILAAADIAVEDETGNIEIFSIVTDSRKVTNGCLFVCIKGTRNDGHGHIDEAIARGASVIVTDDGVERHGDVVFINVDSSRRALAHFYNAYYGFPTEKLKFIGVTGTNGKTSVTFMLKSILETEGYKCGLIGTVNSLAGDTKINIHSENTLAHMTTPDPEELYHILAIMAEEGVEYVIMEVSSHALALNKVDAICFELAVFTNLTPEHLDFHKSMEEYFEAKARLFTLSKRCVICTDSDWGKKMARGVQIPVSTFSTAFENADYFATDIKNYGVDGIGYKLRTEGGAFAIKSRMVGEFTVANTLAAASAALELEISPCVIETAIFALGSVKGRMERVESDLPLDFSVFIDYAHTPDALEKLLSSAAKLRQGEGRIVVLFGCGGDRDKTKRSIMGNVASRLSDFAIITSDNSRSEDPERIIGEIIEGIDACSPFAVIPSRREAIEFAIRNARCGDIILLAGKGHEAYEIDKDGVHDFCEKEIVLEAINFYKRK